MTQRPPFINSMARPLIEGAARYRRRRRRATAAVLVVVAGAVGVFGYSALTGDGSDAVQVTVTEPETPTTATVPAPTTVSTTNTQPPTTSSTSPATTTTTILARTHRPPAVHPVTIDGLPDRYITLQSDGLVSVVDTATAESTELARVRVPRIDDWRSLSMAVDPSGEYVYVGSDPDRDCVGVITRVAVNGGETTEITSGLDPLVSPDGRWLFHTIDGATQRGEHPPEPNDPMAPCRGRHDSYAWMDLTTGEEVKRVAPPLGENMDPVNVRGTTFEPGSHRLYMASWSVYNGYSVVTPESADPLGQPPAFTGQAEDFWTGLVSGLSYLPDGTLLIVGELPNGQIPAGTELYQPPDGYDVGPVDVSNTWWLISGYHGKYPGDWSGPKGTWVWDQVSEPVLLAENVSVRWLP